MTAARSPDGASGRETEGLHLGSASRTPHDATDPTVPVAATLLLARDTAAGTETLMLKRPDRGSFPGAWVFPGGRLEPSDTREGEDETATACRAAVRETWEETGLVVEESSLLPMAMWDPPPGIPYRIRTWFFLAPAPVMPITPSAEEVDEATWLAAEDALARHSRGAFPLYPPTWVMLDQLRGATSIEAIMATARLTGPRRYETVIDRSEGRLELAWHSNPEHAGPAGDSAPTRHVLDVTSLPWSYRNGESLTRPPMDVR